MQTGIIEVNDLNSIKCKLPSIETVKVVMFDILTADTTTTTTTPAATTTTTTQPGNVSFFLVYSLLSIVV